MKFLWLAAFVFSGFVFAAHPLFAAEQLATARTPSTVEKTGPVAPTPGEYQSTGVHAVRAEPVTLKSLPPQLQSILARNSSTRSIKPEHLLNLNQHEMRLVVAIACRRYSQHLESNPAGAHWNQYFQLDQLEKLFNATDDPATFAQARRDLELVQLQTSLAAISKVAENTKYTSLSANHNFIALHRVLAEAVKPTDDRLRRRHFHEHIARLDAQLNQLEQGQSSWREFFQLPLLNELVAKPEAISPNDRMQLAVILSRFEQASAGDQFAAIIRLPGFEETRLELRRHLGVESVPAPQLTKVPGIDDVASTPIETIIPSVPRHESAPTTVRVPSLLAIEGKVEFISPGDSHWRRALVAEKVAVGSIIRTDADDRASLSLSPTMVIALAPLTTVQVVRLPSGKLPAVLEVIRGNVRVAVSESTSAQPSRKPLTLFGQSTLGDLNNVISGESNQTIGLLNPIGENAHQIATISLIASTFQADICGSVAEVDFRHDNATHQALVRVGQGRVTLKNGSTGEEAVVSAGQHADFPSHRSAVRPVLEGIDLR